MVITMKLINTYNLENKKSKFIAYFYEIEKLVEENFTEIIFNNPKEDYTKLLLNSAPTLKQ